MIEEKQQKNVQLAIKLGLLAIGMLGFSVALIPLYDVFAKLAGINGKSFSKIDEKTLAYQIDEQRKIAVDFIIVKGLDIPLEVKLDKTKLFINPGRITELSYTLTNVSNKALNVRTVVSTAPGKAANYFGLMRCICFEPLKLLAGEKFSATLRLVINPELPVDVINIAFAQQFFNIKHEK